MKINNIYRSTVVLSLAVSSFLSGCSDSWLEPKPLSFYTPENSYVDAAGLYSALTTCERNMRGEFFGDNPPILSEFIFTDLAVDGTTDKSGPPMDLDLTLLPDLNLNALNRTKLGWYWIEGFNGIKYANVIITRIDYAEYKDETERNGVLGAAYFHRAYRYNKLVHQFGDVPYLDWEISAPKYDFYSYDRWTILEQMRKDMEFAYKWVPEKVDRGRTSKGACGVLLAKICMALGDFDRAITVGKEVVAMHPLMRNRFTTNKNKPKTNLMHDLHSVEAKLDGSNTEGIMYVVAYPEVEGSATMQIMRQAVPFWNSGKVVTPDNKPGTSQIPHIEDKDTELDLNRLYGRGIGRLRPSNYYQYGLWTAKEKKDLRGVYNRDSWRAPEDLKYNNINLKATGSEWYGKNMIKPVAMAMEDTIRCWFQWPHYKTYVPDPLAVEVKGGESPWYIYRSAEVYLMLAECYYWKDQLGEAATMLNEVRTRAGADALTSADVNIEAILAERGRELYYEENRKSEITRIAYTYAKTGKACEIFGGRTYSLANFSGTGGVNSNIKQEGVNFYYDWVMEKSNFYNKGVVTKFAEYKMSVHHVLWPIPADAINTNLKGIINQNIGYPGAENNVPPLKVPTEGTVLGPQ